MKKLIFTLIAISFSIAAVCQNSDTAAIDKIIKDNGIFETYLVGANDVPSIGALKNIFIDPSAKYVFLNVNSKLSELKVTGTAAPFEKRVPLSQWLTLIKIGEYNNCIIHYYIDNREDGMVLEDLTVDKVLDTGSKIRVRTITIARMEGSIITIWDSN